MPQQKRRPRAAPHRSRIDILSEMLQAANGVNVKKTKLMYKSLLGYAQLTELLSDLTENGLLDYNEKTQTFRTTDKGVRFLKIYNEIKNILGKVVVE